MSDLPKDAAPQPGRYRHFKGREYELMTVGEHTETGELFAIYRAADDPARTWVRPVEMFVETVASPEGSRQRFEPAPSPATASLRRVARRVPRLARLLAGRRIQAGGRRYTF